MKLIVILTAFACCLPVSSFAQGSSWTSDQKLTHRLDLGPSLEHPERMGIHYDVRYQLNLTRPDPDGHHFGFAIGTLGFEDNKRDNASASFTHTEVSLQGRYYDSGYPAALEPEVQRRYLELLDKEMNELSEQEDAELVQLTTRSLSGSFLLSYDAHYRYEAAVQSELRQHAVGAAVSARIPWIHTALDFIPSLTRPGVQYKSRAVRCYIGFDKLFVDRGMVDDITFVENHSRIQAQFAWSTLLFTMFTARVIWTAQYIIDASEAMKNADLEFSNLLQAWVLYPLDLVSGVSTGIMIKYSYGRAAPSYTKTDEVNFGLNVAVL